MSGEQMAVLARCGQWEFRIPETELPEGFEALQITGYKVVNPAPDGSERFYIVVPGQYDEPLIFEEPTLHLGLPWGEMDYRTLKGEKTQAPQENIVGLILADKNGEQALHRFSMTNAKKQGFEVQTDKDGDLFVTHQGKTARYRIVRLLRANKNRIRGLVAVAVLDGHQDQIQVCELEDLALVGLAL